METNALDAGQIAILAIALLVACVALTTWLRSPKSQTAREAELLVQVRNGLREANGSLTQLKTTVQQQQLALDGTAQAIAAIRQKADDHTGELKSAIETVSAAIDATRAETNARCETANNQLDEISAATVDAKENAEAVLQSIGGLRGRMDTVINQARAIPPLGDRIDRLQQDVAAIAEAASKATPDPAADEPPAPAADRPRRPGRSSRKTATNKDRTRGRRGRNTAEANETATSSNGNPVPETARPADSDAPDAGKTGAAETREPPETAGNGAAGAAPVQSGQDTEEAPHTDAADAAEATR